MLVSELIYHYCRFFSPTIIFLNSRGHNLHLLCMSTCNAMLLTCDSVFESMAIYIWFCVNLSTLVVLYYLKYLSDMHHFH